MAEGKKSFVIYTSWNTWLEAFTNEQKGLWLSWVMDYCNDQNPELPQDQAVKVGCLIAKDNLKRDLKKYEERVERMNTNRDKSRNHDDINMISDRNHSDIGGVNVNVNDNVNVLNKDKLDKLDKHSTHTHEGSSLQGSIAKQKKHLQDNGLNFGFYMHLDYKIRPYYYTMKLDEIKADQMNDFYLTIRGNEECEKVFFYTLDKILKSDFKPDNFYGYFKSVYDNNFTKCNKEVQ